MDNTYNCDAVITYKSVEDEADSNDQYRKDFLTCFGTTEYDDSIGGKLDCIFEHTKDTNGFVDLYSAVRSGHNVADEMDLCMVYMFSYEYFYLFHEILVRHIRTGTIDQTRVDAILGMIPSN